jgi:epoxide hydrolase-like predicted phosphatase
LKGLIADFGGVLTTSIFDSFYAFCDEHEIPHDHFRDVFRAIAAAPESLFHLVETGRIDEEEFNRRMAEALSNGLASPLDPDGLKHRLFALARLDQRMEKAIETLHDSGIKTCLLSNSWGGKDYPMDILGKLFDAIVISGEVGMRKPDAEIYLLAVERIGLDPPQCVFIDDLQHNVEAAEAVGMTGLHHTETESTVAELERIFGVSLSLEPA